MDCEVLSLPLPPNSLQIIIECLKKLMCNWSIGSIKNPSSRQSGVDGSPAHVCFKKRLSLSPIGMSLQMESFG